MTMNLRRKITILIAALVMGIGLLAPFLAPQPPVAEAGLWCGQSCGGSSVAPTPPPTF
jgi:hypothetical protein